MNLRAPKKVGNIIEMNIQQPAKEDCDLGSQLTETNVRHGVSHATRIGPLSGCISWYWRKSLPWHLLYRSRILTADVRSACRYRKLLLYFCHYEAEKLFLAARLMRRRGHISQQSSSPVMSQEFDVRIFSTTLWTKRELGRALFRRKRGNPSITSPSSKMSQKTILQWQNVVI
jgi:hypothetical protein